MYHAQRADQAPPPPASSPAIERHPLRFTGSAGQYFRVWIVNVLLSVLTLGFYTPWARRRTAQFFYSHSLVAGSPLEFTAQQRRMVLGFVLLVLITLAFRIAANTGQDRAAATLLLAGAALAPYFWASAMRFRLGATRWRGLRLQFAAGWKEVYLASWPVFALAALWIGVIFGVTALIPALSPSMAPGAAPPRALWQAGPVIGLIGMGIALSLLCVIRLEFNYRRLLVLRTRLGTEAGRWKPVYGDFVRVWLATVGVFLGTMLLIALALMAVVGSSVLLAAAGTRSSGLAQLVAILVAGVVAIVLAVLASAPARAYREARMFQLLWSNIGLSQLGRFKCQLSARRFVLLRVKNMLLTLLTLGLYRPFARVSEYRMKLESVTLYLKGGVDQIAGQLARQQEGGLGDALADAVGLDLIG